VPKLRSPLLSVRCFRRLHGCSFVADNSGSFLTFPDFVLPVDDSSDCTIDGCLGAQRSVDFDSCLVGCSAAVSDNTRFRKSRHPARSSSSPQPSTLAAPVMSSPQPTLADTPDLPSIPEEKLTSLPSEQLKSILEDLNIPSSTTSDDKLSPTQLQEVTTAIVAHLQKYGCVTTELLHFIRDGYTSKKNSTSTTPEGRPTLLASDKSQIPLHPTLVLLFSNFRVTLVSGLSKIGICYMMFVFQIFLLYSLLKHLLN
jgi:hypothetical protein